jgi:hypothetical protein
MGRLLKFWSLSRREKQFLCEAGTLLLLSNLSIKSIAFRHIDNFLRSHWNDGAPGPEHADDINLVKFSVSRAANVLPSQSRCLSRSIAELIMLRRRGIPAVMYMGVKSSEHSSLHAHAWVLTGRQVTNETSKNSTYVPLVMIGQE